MNGEVEVPMARPMPRPPFGVRAKRSVVVAHFDEEPETPQPTPVEVTSPPVDWRQPVAAEVR